MTWTGRGGSSPGRSWETFRGPDGREVTITMEPNTPLNEAQKKAYKKWKAGS